MAQLAVKGLGALVSTALGAGPSIGWTIGSALGGVLFPEKSGRSNKPDIPADNFADSCLGKVIARGWGTAPQQAKVIWCGKTERHVDKDASVSGGKGGGASTSSDGKVYRFTKDLLLDFGFGPGDVLALWAGPKLIYDVRPEAEKTIKDGLKITVQRGTMSQMPIPEIQEIEGDDIVPAWRGHIQVFLKDFELGDHGNVTPPFRALIAYVSERTISVLPGTPIDGIQTGFRGALAFDYIRQRLYGLQDTADGDGALFRMRASDMVMDRQIAQDDALGYAGGGFWASTEHGITVLPTGQIIVTEITTEQFVSLHPVTLHFIAGYGSTNGPAIDTNPKVNHNLYVASCYGTNGGLFSYVLGHTIFNQDFIFAAPSMQYVWDQGIDSSDEQFIGGDGSTVTGIVGRPESYGYAEFYLIMGDTITAGLYHINRISVAAGTVGETGGSDPIFGDITIEDACTFTLDDLSAGATSSSDAPSNPVWDRTDNTIIFTFKTNVDTNGRLAKIDPATSEIKWVTEDVANAFREIQNYAWSQSYVGDGTLGVVFDPPIGGDQRRYSLIDTRTGEYLVEYEQFDIPETFTQGGARVYDSRTNAVYAVSQAGTPDVEIIKFFIGRMSGLDTTHAVPVADYAEFVGVPDSEINVAALEAIPLKGLTVDFQCSPADITEMLSSIGFYDMVESEYVLKFVVRGGASARTLTADDFAYLDGERSGKLVEVTMQDVDLPEEMQLGYLDPERDYQANVQSYRRHQVPDPTMGSHNTMSVKMPVVLEKSDGAQIVHKWIMAAYNERKSLKARLSRRHGEIEPTDVVTLRPNDSVTYRARITQQDIGVSRVMEIDLVAEDVDQFVSFRAGVGSETFEPSVIPSASRSELFALDMPLLRDIDEPAGRTLCPLYFFTGTDDAAAGWPGAAIYKGTDPTSLLRVAESLTRCTWGVVAGILADPPNDDPFAVDETNTLKVVLAEDLDAPTSVTDEEFYNETNSAVIVKANGEVETIIFRDVTANADQSITLSYLGRGMRGTDTMCFDHGSAELILFASTSDGRLLSLALSELNATRYYKAVTFGTLLDDAELTSITHQHRALMPYHPCNHTAEIDGSDNLTLGVDRRTRVNGEWNDFTEDVPLNEDIELYDLEILDGPGGTVVHTEEDLTSPSFVYSAAAQTGDGFTPPLSSITVKWYQKSGQVGRGFTRETTVTVT